MRPRSSIVPGGISKNRPREEEPDAPESNKGLAAVVKKIYVAARSGWLSRVNGRRMKYRPSAVYDGQPAVTLEGAFVAEKAKKNEWEKLATWLEQNQYPPEAYISLQFERLGITSVPLEPKQLTSARCVEEWGAHQAPMDAILAQDLTASKRCVGVKVSVQEAYGGADRVKALVRTLTNERLPLSPLFRYCLARKIGGPRLSVIAKAYELGASLQFYEQRVSYTKMWADFIPEGFAAVAEKRYAEWLSDQ